MRIREIVFRNFRSFRGERRISFVDPVTETTRPVTVLAGSNGCGKTTVLDVIEAALKWLVEPKKPQPLLTEMRRGGWMRLTVEFDSGEADWHRHGHLDITVDEKVTASDFGLVEELRQRVAAWQEAKDYGDMRGGLLYFPHDRRLSKHKGGPVEPPADPPRWLFRFSPGDKWRGSLEQLWVWQNYLDLEKSKRHSPNLKPFVETVEEVLGGDRRITVEEGRAMVPVTWTDKRGEIPRVRLDQLPSGEQQVLLLFGELARRRRPGAVIAIDEIENSLHPTLQRQVMWNLNRLAREGDAQVIVATHSLEVINTVRGGAFINLDYPEDRFNLPVPALEETPA